MTTDLHHLSASYALDALDVDERREFEVHLAGCDTCRRDVDDFRVVAGLLATATTEAPPAHLRSAVMSQLGEVEQESSVPPAAPVIDLAERRRRKFSMTQMLSAAAAVAILAIGAIVISGTRGGSDYDEVVAAPDAQVVQLVGESGTVAVVWSPERDQVALSGDGLADLDPDLRYALWAIADGTPIPAGLFDADEGSIRDVVDIDLAAAQVWAITIEPASGSDVPTSDPIFRSA